MGAGALGGTDAQAHVTGALGARPEHTMCAPRCAAGPAGCALGALSLF